jgi:hypothetical protein
MEIVFLLFLGHKDSKWQPALQNGMLPFHCPPILDPHSTVSVASERRRLELQSNAERLPRSPRLHVRPSAAM